MEPAIRPFWLKERGPTVHALRAQRGFARARELGVCIGGVGRVGTLRARAGALCERGCPRERARVPTTAHPQIAGAPSTT